MIYVNYILKYPGRKSVMGWILKWINHKIAINPTGLRCGGNHQEQQKQNKKEQP